MTSDRELLEQAAKVAGINGTYYPAGLESEGLGCHDPELGFFTWNPLSSDGDALRLAVALRIAVSQFSSACAAQRPGWPLFTEEFKGDNCRATRRVIVRAVAAMAPPVKQTNTSGKAHCPHCGICHTREESCEQAVARVDSILRPGERK